MSQLILYRVEKDGLRFGERLSKGAIVNPREFPDRQFSKLEERGDLTEVRISEEELERHRAERSARQEHDAAVQEARKELEAAMQAARDYYANATAEAEEAFDTARAEARQELEDRLEEIRGDTNS